MRTLLLALLAVSTAAQAAPPPLTGTWRNAADSVRIRIARCGAPRANGGAGSGAPGGPARAKAQADAARGGADRLVGTELFRDFRRENDGLWYGQVYVPDIGQTFDGTLELSDANTLVGTGCLFAGFGCKTQMWKRVR